MPNGLLSGLAEYHQPDVSLQMLGLFASLDMSLTGGTATFNGSAAVPDGKSIVLNGSGYFKRNNTVIVPVGGSFSFAQWWKETFPPSLGSGLVNTTDSTSWEVQVTMSGIGIEVDYFTDNDAAQIGATRPVSAAWHRAVETFDLPTKTLSYYLDGALVSAATLVDPTSTTSPDIFYVLGSGGRGGLGGVELIGELGPCAAWSVPLSLAQVVADWNSGVGLPYSSYDNGGSSSGPFLIQQGGFKQLAGNINR